MGRYVYIEKDSNKGRFGIGVDVFTTLVNEALGRVPGLINEPIEKRHHHLQFNSSEIDIHRGVVYVKVNINAKKDFNVQQLKKQVSEEIHNSFMMVAEQVPVEIKIKIENII